MTPPKRAPRAMRKLMVECWAHEEPKERPRMSSAQKQIAELLNDQSWLVGGKAPCALSCAK
jgi:hypothetical protein